MADCTLDEIIKQKRLKKFGGAKQNNRVNQNQKVAPRAQGNPMMNKKARLFREVQKDLGITTKKAAVVALKTDARNRIIQKKRIKFMDARDRLAQIAKQGDARDKLNQIRKTQPGEKQVPGVQQKKAVMKKKNVNVPKQALNVPRQAFNVPRQAFNVPRQAFNVPKQALRTGQTRMKGTALVRTVAGGEMNRKKKIVVRGNPGMVKQAGFVSKAQRAAGRTLPIANNPSVITIKNNNAQLYEAYDIPDYREELQFGQHNQHFQGMGMPTAMDGMLMRSEPVMRGRPVDLEYVREYEPEIRPARLRITAANTDYRVGGQQYANEWQQPQQQQQHHHAQAWQQPNRMQPRKRELYDEQVEYQAYPKKIAPVPAQQIQGDRGTKVIVSNLHPCVSVEDMEELFGTIGSILSVRMVRQGVAEAMFVSQDDAYRSVDLFNNRQLDGQPMKVMVVRKKAPLMTAQAVQARSVLKSARGRTGYYVQ